MKDKFKKSYNKWQKNEILIEDDPIKIYWECEAHSHLYVISYYDVKEVKIVTLYPNNNGYDIYLLDKNPKTKKAQREERNKELRESLKELKKIKFTYK